MSIHYLLGFEMNEKEIEAMIKVGLPHDLVEVTGDGYHFEAVVVSSAFEGLTTLQRHRAIYATLGAAMGNEIHALSIQSALTPAENK
tara:strand:- start:2443 stop:2703 length:261 start_codon:yes stop_codon:yes gene_type:complete